MSKYFSFEKSYTINSKEIKISEKSLLDNFTGVTPVNSLCSEFGNITLVWDYVKNTNAFGKATVPADRDDADYILVDLLTDALSIRISNKNDNHENLSKINEMIAM